MVGLYERTEAPESSRRCGLVRRRRFLGGRGGDTEKVTSRGPRARVQGVLRFVGCCGVLWGFVGFCGVWVLGLNLTLPFHEGLDKTWEATSEPHPPDGRIKCSTSNVETKEKCSRGYPALRQAWVVGGGSTWWWLPCFCFVIRSSTLLGHHGRSQEMQ